jgi:hypothetical protein
MNQLEFFHQRSRKPFRKPRDAISGTNSEIAGTVGHKDTRKITMRMLGFDFAEVMALTDKKACAGRWMEQSAAFDVGISVLKCAKQLNLKDEPALLRREPSQLYHRALRCGPEQVYFVNLRDIPNKIPSNLTQ